MTTQGKPMTPSEKVDALEDAQLAEFNKRIAKHYFCPVCGIYTFHRPRTAPELWGVNVRCLEGVDLDAIEIKQVHGSQLD